MKKSYLYYLIPTILFFAACKTNSPKEDPCKGVKTEAEAAQTMFNNQMTDVRGTKLYEAISNGGSNGYLAACNGDTLATGLYIIECNPGVPDEIKAEGKLFSEAKDTRDITLPNAQQQVIECQAQNPEN
ncbi:MAG: hypothetical protein LBN95_14275 [Prevotellaceae bacterium]|jgi:hypothetical protein|nr:hypothetical protein [Prevotellaceae bacterium]